MAGKDRDVNLNVTATEETGPATAAAGRNIDGLQRKVDGFNTKKPTAEVTRFTSAFTKSAKDGESASKSLQRAIDDTEARIAKIRKDFNSPGSNGVQLFGDLKNETSNLRTLENAFKAVTGEVEQAAVGGDNLKGTLIQLGVAASPFLLPVAAGSVLGVLAFGGVGAGILGQLKNGQVQVALSAFGSDVSSTLTNATSAFGPALVSGLGVAETGVTKFINDLKPAFNALAPEVTKIATDFSHALDQAGPSLSKSLIAARPDLEALSRLIASLPEDVASFAAGLSAGAEGGAQAIDDLDNELKTLTADLGTGLGAVSQLYGAISQGEHFLDNASGKFGGLGTVLSTVFHGADDALDPITQISHAATGLQKLLSFGGGSSDKLSASVSSVGKAASVADPPLRVLNTGMEAAGVAAGTSYPDIQAIGKSMDSMGEHAGTSTPAVQAIGKSVQSMGEHASTSIPAVDAIGKSMTSMGEHAGTSNLATQALGFSVTSLGEHAGTSDPAVLAVGKSMQSMGEHAGTSNLATQTLGFAVQSMGEHAGLANPAVDAVGRSMQSLGEHSGSAIGQLNGAQSAVQSLAPSAEATSGAFNDLAKSIAASSNQALILAGDQLGVAQSLADFTKALHDNGKGFDENTQSGRDNESALLGALGALQKNYQAQADAGKATFDTTQKYNDQVNKLIDLAEKNGLAKDTADDLRSSLEKVAGSYPVTVPIHVAESASTASLIARTTGQRVAFGSADYLDAGFAFAPGGGGRGGDSGAQWSMPPVQIDHSSKLTTYLDGRVVAQSVDRHTASARSHQRHAARVGAL